MNFPAFDEIYALLLHVDADRAERARQDDCPACGAPVHSARYPRKPRGLPLESLEGLDTNRFSFCCSREGCRKRLTPPSVRFLDRRVYLSIVVVLVTAVRQGPTPPGMRQIRQLVGADRKTVLRWRRWWQEEFPNTKLWQWRKAFFVPPVRDVEFPRTVLERFHAACPIQRLLLFLDFLASSAIELSRLSEGLRRPAEDVAWRRKRANCGQE